MDKNIFRSSFLVIFDNTLKYTFIAVGLIVTNFAIIVKKIKEFNLNVDINFILIIFLFLFIVCIFIYNLIKWKLTKFEIKDDMVIIYKNFLTNEKKEFFMSNIANICISKNIFERIFKLTRVRIFTNKRNNFFDDLNIVLQNKVFDEYIDNFLIEKNKIKFNFFDIVKHSFLSIPLSSIIVVVDFILLIFSMLNNGTFFKGIVYNFFRLVITLIVFILPVIYSMLKNTIKYFDFSIKRDKEYISVSYGLFTKKEYIISVNKINGVILDSSLLTSIFRCYKVTLINSGIGDRKNELEIIFPILTKKRCIEILNKILPEYSIKIEHQNRIYESISQILSAVLIPLMYINVKISTFIIVLLFFSYFIKRTVVTPNNICVIRGIFVKRIRIINYEKIEYIKIKQSFISKKLGICKVYIYIMADIKNRKISTGYIKNKYACNILPSLS